MDGIPMPPHLPDWDFAEHMATRTPWLRRVAYLLCQDWDQADDLAQISMTRLYAHWPRDRTFQNLDGHLRAILVDTFISETRRPWWKRIVSPGHVAEDLAVETPDLDVSLSLRDAFATLPPRQRAALVLRYYCDLTVKQTAAELNCSQSRVKSHTSRAIASLCALLEIEGGVSA
ncbi:SigE family RNA polymerase sigma factor [Actinospica robiniae]|uniref:SigE family RNA polymerase sigma factor n=1 Tax=Actinospica robiniae TaxID=304901 RepID=UPI000401B88A|nr:SigE family RNA polymerase sigma factor [Actinospica robiniae]